MRDGYTVMLFKKNKVVREHFFWYLENALNAFHYAMNNPNVVLIQLVDNEFGEVFEEWERRD